MENHGTRSLRSRGRGRGRGLFLKITKTATPRNREPENRDKKCRGVQVRGFGVRGRGRGRGRVQTPRSGVCLKPKSELCQNCARLLVIEFKISMRHQNIFAPKLASSVE